jgi:hypothetical protein
MPNGPDYTLAVSTSTRAKETRLAFPAASMIAGTAFVHPGLRITQARVRSVVLKLARGHAVYELDEQKSEAPSHVMIAPLHTLAPHAREHFENPPATAGWPEVGTRAMQRMAVSTAFPPVIGQDWIEVQRGQYLLTLPGFGIATVVYAHHYLRTSRNTRFQEWQQGLRPAAVS